MRTLKLGLIGFDFATETLCFYLWGRSVAPEPAELASGEWIDRQKPITLQVDPNEFFSLVGRDTFNAKDIKLFKTFFSGKTIERNVLNSGNALNETQYDEHKDGKYYLTQKQFADLFYGEYKNNKEPYDNKKLKEDVYGIALNPYDDNAASISLYDRNILKPNFAKIAFVFGSVKLGLDTSNIRYVLDENLNPLAVENVRYKLDLGDFDFEGGEGSEEVNKILKQIADPSGIGKKVNLEFDKEAKIYAGDITKEDYASLKDWKDLKTKLGVGNPPAPIDNELSVEMVKYAKFLDEFNRIKEVSKAIDYLDENGKIVMFRGNENDKMVGTKAANFDYSDNVETEFKGHKIPFKGGLLNHFKGHIKNGITYVGGKGSDSITGTDYDDILYGHDKEGKDDDEATDTLVGGKGSDKLYGGRGNDTLVGHTGSMIDDNIRDELYGGDDFDTYYVGDKDVIFDSDGKGIVVFEGVELKGGTYDKDKGAYVSKDGLIEYRLNESGGKSTLTVQKGGKSITINEFNKEDKSLGIKLANSKVEVSVTNKEGSANWLKESLGDRGLPFTMSLNRKLDKGEYLKVEVVTSMKGDKKSIIEFKEGDIGKDFNFTWDDDNYPQGNRSFVVNAYIVDESSDLTAEIVSNGRGMIKDDDRNPNYPNDPENAPMYYDPIIIDLNKDGTTTSKLNGAVNFDIDNNGFKEATGWISKDDAFLAYDRNGNGIIDNGNELFGDKTVSVGAYGYTGETAKNGFEALKAFDFNNDNIIDEKDKDFDKLLLWQDLNTNGLTEEGELKSLKEHNVKSIDLRYKETQIDNNGNLIKQTSTVTFNDNTTTTADDVWFKVDLRYTEQPSINIPERIKALPEVTAFGNLHNLRSAMSENLGLENMIKDYIGLTPEEKVKQLDNVLFKWAGVEGVDKDSRGQFIDARMLGAYEKISGKPFLQWGNSPNPSLPAANIIMGIMNKFKNYVSANIELQTKYKGLIDTTYMYYNDDTNKYDYDFSKVNAKLKELYNAKNYKELSLLSGIVRDAAQYKSELLDSFKNNLEKLASNNDDFALFALSDYISGTDKDDVIQGKSNHNLFIGGKGNDVFHGRYGKNAYIYHKGDGNDTIHDNGNESTIYFEDIRRDEVEFSNQGGRGLNIKVKGTQDSINIKQYYIYNDILLKFSDKTVLSGKNISLTVAGDDGDNDLYGYIGNDILEGGKGNDILIGNEGVDTYVFGRGDGKDVIYALDADFKQFNINSDGNYNIPYYYNQQNVKGTDIIKFKEGISKNDLIFERAGANGYDLLVKIKDTDDSITVKDMFSDDVSSRGIDKIEFADGSFMDIEDIHKSTPIITNQYNQQQIYGSMYSDTIIGDERNNSIQGKDGNDVIHGYEGEDKLYGDAGNDTLIGGKGNDYLDGGNGNDVYIYNKGDGNDTIYDANGTDTIKFGSGISKQDIIVKRTSVENIWDYRNITISFKNSPNDSITILDVFANNVTKDSNIIETFEFENGERLSFEDIKKLSLIGSNENETLSGYNDFSNIIKGNGGDDALYGGNINDTIYGGDGNDRLYGNGGDDTLYGNEGDDILEGGSGNDTLMGGKGNDSIKGEEGDDIIEGGEGDDDINGYVGDDTLRGNEGDDKIYGGSGNDWLNGGDGNDILYGNEGNDTLMGQDGDDELNGGDGNDVLEGGSGNDTLDGGDGEDTYAFARGDGQDTIVYSDGKDIIKFKSGIAKDDLIFKRITPSNPKDNLMIRIKDTQDSILIKNMLDKEDGSSGIKGLKFDDGSFMSFNEIRQKALMTPIEGDYPVYGFDSDDTIMGGDADNQIYGKSGNDTLYGGKGNDELHGETGNDTLYGGEGNDTLHGGEGADTYVFGKGDGNDKVYSDENDTIKLKEGIARDDIDIQKLNDRNLKVSIKQTGDSVTVYDIFNQDYPSKIGKIEFSDGSFIDFESIKQIASNNTAYCVDDDNNRIDGSDKNDIMYGNKDTNYIRAGAGDDILIGGEGNDELYGDWGADTYIFGRGDGQDTIYADGEDIIKFKEGITRDDILITRDHNDLVIKLKDSDDSVRVSCMLYGSDDDSNDNPEGIKAIEFSDGSSLGLEYIRKIVLANENSMFQDDNVYGFSSDDIINGSAEREAINARSGNDVIDGKGGNDTIIGGKGDDTLIGGEGDDIYEYYLGDGSDTIDNTGGGNDTLLFAYDIPKNSISYKKDNNDLLVTINNDPSQAVRIKNHFLGGDYAIDRIGFGQDGSYVDQEYILKQVNAVHLSSQGGNNYLSDKDKKDNIYTYTGGKVTISDNGGDDRVVFKLDNPGDGLFYLSNGRDLKISTNKIDASNNDVLEIKNFFVNRSSIIENFDINDYWSVTAESIYEQYGKTFPSETPGTPPSNPGGSDDNSLTGGSEDNVFNYKGGMVSITDTGGNDKVIFTNPGSRVFYSSDGIDLMISTAKIDSSNNNILQVKNFFASKDSIIETFQINDRWSVTAQSIYKAFGKTYPNQTAPVNNNPTTPPNSDNLIGGKEDNVFTYTGGKKSITDTGGNDKVIFAKQGSKVFYSSDGVNLKISTAKINSSNKDVLEVKNFFSDKNAIIEEFQISNHWAVTAESIYQAFGKTYPTSTDTKNAPLALLGIPNNTSEAGLNDNNSSDT